jgi:hypothetical protein
MRGRRVKVSSLLLSSELGNISDGEPDDMGDARVVEDMLE